MDSSIKQYADSLYEKALRESVDALRRESVKYMQERSRNQGSSELFSGIDFQAQIRFNADHIQRSTAARLDSYRKAFDEIGRTPTESELGEICAAFKATWDSNITHSIQALANFVAVRNAPAGLDVSDSLRAQSAYGHDRVLQEWKIWRSRVLLQKSISSSEAHSHNRIPASANRPQALRTESAEDKDATEKTGQGGVKSSAFISYSWDDDSHREWVRLLAERLCADGIDVSIDRWAAAPGDQLPAFMERSIRGNEFVVIICTPRYKRRSDTREGGVGYEGDIMTAEVMTSQNHRKFIPVLRSGSWTEAAPSWLVGKYHINLSGDPYSERDYEDLVRTLLGIRETAPPIGKPMTTIGSRTNQDPPIFEDVKITRVVIEDITEPTNDGSPRSALYSIPFALSVSPTSAWVELFIQNWNRPPRWTGMHRSGIASVHGAMVTLDGTTIEEVEQYHRDTLQLVVAETNRQYRDLLLKQQQRSNRESAKREEHRKSVEDVTKRIKFD